MRSFVSIDGPINVCGGKFWTIADACEKYGKNVTTDLGIPNVQSEVRTIKRLSLSRSHLSDDSDEKRWFSKTGSGQP
jgi:hypothetical protein